MYLPVTALRYGRDSVLPLRPDFATVVPGTQSSSLPNGPIRGAFRPSFAMLSRNLPPEDLAERLLQRAIESGGPGNAAVALAPLA